MIHIDLFSGIGGFALAVDAVWDNVEHIFCEIDPYCQALLKKRFEGSVIYGDIRTLTNTDRAGSGASKGETYINRQKVNERWEKQSQFEYRGQNCFILTGGFPCQPFSQAGKRRGTDDNRYLWPEMLRCIRDFKPTWVIAENVRGILTIEQGMVFEQVCLDLEREGYEVQAFVIPAVSKNAPHRRDRVWFVANRRCERQEEQEQQTAGSEQCDSNAPDTAVEGRNGDWVQGSGRHGFSNRTGENETRHQSSAATRWEQNWLEVATELCGVDDGLPAELHGLKLSKPRHRVERLKALGNSIVPQVAIEIMKGIRNDQHTNIK